MSDENRHCPMCNRVVPDGASICPFCAAGLNK